MKQSDIPALEKCLADLLGADVSIPAETKGQGCIGTRDAKRLAKLVADKYEWAARQARDGHLVESQARKVIADIYAAASTEKMPSMTAGSFLDSWLKRKELECSESTFVRYENVATRFKEFLGSKAKLNLASITSKDIVLFRDDLVKQVSSGTANLHLKCLRVAFGQGVKDGLIDENPAARVSILKQKDRNERRPFTMPELKKLLAVADNTWTGLIMVGLYTGLRLSDAANLTWANIDLQSQEICLVTKKTGRRQRLPMAAPLLRYVESLPAGDKTEQPLFPNVCNKPVSTLSNQFSRIMAAAGLATASEHRSTGKGRSVRRQRNEICFHALRHTATSLLKNAGVSEAVAMEFIGHDSPEISANYTHIDAASLRRAANVMPDITKP